MLAFSIDYYGIFFRATQSVELFCAYFIWINAPVINPRNKLSETEISAYANKTKMYLVIFSVLFILAVFWEKQILLDGILYATLCIAMAMISGKVKYSGMLE